MAYGLGGINVFTDFGPPIVAANNGGIVSTNYIDRGGANYPSRYYRLPLGPQSERWPGQWPQNKPRAAVGRPYGALIWNQRNLRNLRNLRIEEMHTSSGFATFSPSDAEKVLIRIPIRMFLMPGPGGGHDVLQFREFGFPAQFAHGFVR